MVAPALMALAEVSKALPKVWAEATEVEVARALAMVMTLECLVVCLLELSRLG